jgi:hypothetical protein
MTRHYTMLQRSLLHTGVTRGKRLVVLVGQKKAVAIAVRNVSGRWGHARNARDGRACCVADMSKTPDRMIAGFTTGERDYIRREPDMVFSTLPSVAEGFQLKTWRGGPDAGKPKLSPIAKALVARGLMRLDVSGRFPRLFFTETGLAALRAMMMDRRLADPKKFAHVRQEFGIDSRSEDDTQPNWSHPSTRAG